MGGGRGGDMQSYTSHNTIKIIGITNLWVINSIAGTRGATSRTVVPYAS